MTILSYAKHLQLKENHERSLDLRDFFFVYIAEGTMWFLTNERLGIWSHDKRKWCHTLYHMYLSQSVVRDFRTLSNVNKAKMKKKANIFQHGRWYYPLGNIL